MIKTLGGIAPTSKNGDGTYVTPLDITPPDDKGFDN